jgi:CubicO group peptidase (beta-lactamase class C family)
LALAASVASAALALPTAWLPAQDARAIPAGRLDAVTQFVERTHRRLGLPGVAVSIATGDSVLLAAGFGRGSLAGEDITGRTPFLIGSVSKTFTATAVAGLVEDGRLRFDEPVEDALPDFAMRPPFVPRSISARALLTHRSGLRQWSGHDLRAQETGAFAHFAPRGAPGERAEYSSLNFIILGRMVEAIAAMPYAAYLEQRILAPSGMSDAFVAGDALSEGPRRMASGHQSYFGLTVARREPLPPRFLVPAGFVAASARDLGRFGGMLVGGGQVDGERVLADSSVAALLGPLDTTGMAMSWGRRRVDGRLFIEHAGNARTSSARVRLVPQEGYAIAVLANTNSGPFFPATGDLLNGIQAILDGREPPATWPRERIFKGVLLAGAAFSLLRLGQRARDWDRAARPTRIDASGRVIAPLAVDVVGAGLLLFALPRYFGVPLPTMYEYFPDLGIALVTSAGAGLAGGLLHAWTRSGR